MKRFALAAATMLFVVAFPSLGAQDSKDGKGQKQTVYLADHSGYPDVPTVFVPIHGDWTRLSRYSDRIKVEASLSMLDPNSVYNVHIWIFNHTDACQGDPAFMNLGGKCYAFPDQFSGATLPSVVSFGGFIPDRSGRLDLKLDLKISEGLPPVGLFDTAGSFTSAVLPAGGISVGLTDPMNAEVQFVVARKGPVQPELVLEQFQSVFGACGPGFTLPPFDPSQLCVNVRFSMIGGTL